MLAASFNTMPLTRKLRDKANFTQIEAEETAIAESVAEWQSTMPFATHEDAQTIRAEVQSVRDEVKTLDTKISETKVEIMRWMFAQTVVIVGMVVEILRFSGH